MKLSRIWFLVLSLVVTATFPHVSHADGKNGCPATLPPNPPFVPLSRHGQAQASGSFLYGTPALWAVVHTAWHLYYGGKLPYFSQYFDQTAENDPRLTVVARRLDGPDPLVWAPWANSAYIEGTMERFITTGLSVPTAGCWEIAAHYNPTRGNIQTLTYTVWVTQ